MAASNVLDRVKMTTATTGTGTITLGSASTGFFSMSEAGAVDGQTYAYVIEEGNDFEIGEGVYTASGTTLTRNNVKSKISGTAGTTKMTLAGAATVSITLRKEEYDATVKTRMSTQNTTSGTSINFTSIPAGVNRIILTLRDVSLSGSASMIVQIGAGSVTTTGYLGNASSNTSNTQPTIGFGLHQSGASGNSYSGTAILTRVGTTDWVFSAVGETTGSNNWINIGAGRLALGGTLDRVRLTTSNGTDTFDAGACVLTYEY